MSCRLANWPETRQPNGAGLGASCHYPVASSQLPGHYLCTAFFFPQGSTSVPAQQSPAPSWSRSSSWRPCRQTHACCPSWAQQGRHCLGMLSRSGLHPTSDHPAPISLSFLLSLQVLGPGHGRESLAYGFKNMFSVSTSVIKPLGPVTSSLSTPVPSDLTSRVSYSSSQ